MHQAKVFYLQANNKVAENKSIFNFGFAALLIMKGVFREVYMCYLPPSHTHEDVDQLFSIWKQLVKHTSAHLPRQFLEVVDRAFQKEEQQPTVLPVEMV